VVVFPHATPWQIPRELMHAVQTTMTPRIRSGHFVLYSRRGVTPVR
jgi:hypothetical protein